jgi:hypothetical protein
VESDLIPSEGATAHLPPGAEAKDTSKSVSIGFANVTFAPPSRTPLELGWPRLHGRQSERLESAEGHVWTDHELPERNQSCRLKP